MDFDPNDPWGEKQGLPVGDSKLSPELKAKKRITSTRLTVNTEPYARSSAVVDALGLVVEHINGSLRQGQIDMAEAVASAMESQSHLLVQAGTGTGKSLGYLVPAILRAKVGVSGDGKNRTVIATATLALQRQLAEYDLPKAVEAIATDVSFAVLKGRSNFVCLDKFHRAETVTDEEPALFEVSTSRLGKQAKKLRAWAEESSTGDRDEFEGDLDGRLWRAISVSGRECIGASKCTWGQECFAELARAKAHESDIVITNHALLAIDLIDGIPLIPDHDAIVIDEAHELVDRTTNALAGSLDAKGLERTAGLARKYIQPATYERLLAAGDDLQVILPVVAGQDGIKRLEELPKQLQTALSTVAQVAASALNDITASSQDDPETAAAKQRAKAAITEAADATAKLLASDEYTVRWLDSSRDPVLHHAPLSVAGFLQESLFSGPSVTLTSATLQVADSMESTAKAVGLGSSSSWTSLDVGSPFDYAKQGILYCASHLPPPSSAGVAPEMLDELADLIDAAGGRTLALFSSWRGVERAAEYLEVRFRNREDRPLIVATRGDSVGELVKQFKASPHASLLGTVSLWQGIDVPGDSCTLVTIDRIPFPRPDDPVMSARSAKVDEAGGSGFRSVALPRAALLLAQGVGRLIRTTEDRGVVAVLDSRLANAGYAGLLRKSVPPLWWTTNADVVKNALSRLDKESDSKGKV
jgi:ATP-dependent DNA helicase DinG